jgi:peptidoglycan-associated lipoprotein
MSLARSFTLLTPLAAAVLAFAAVGCSHHVAPPQNAGADHDANAQSAQSQAIRQAASDADGGGVKFSDDIKRLCPGLQDPEFSFDSAVVQSSWSNALSGLASCMKSGGLKGQRVVLTGHTDPRGDDDYNVALGGRRADSVRRAVATFGVDGSRMDTSSRGKADATGADEAGWRHDRRVDIDLAQSNRSAAR